MVIKMVLKYEIKDNSVIFWCPGIDENNEAADLINKFLLDISKKQKVFFYGYRLPDEYAFEMIDPAVILAKAQSLMDPFHTFFYLSEAKVKANYSEYACEATIYYFQDKVEWTDFLASLINMEPRKLMKKGILSAYFTTVDQGADFWFECSKDYEEKVLHLLESISKLGYKVKRSHHLSFPYSK